MSRSSRREPVVRVAAMATAALLASCTPAGAPPGTDDDRPRVSSEPVELFDGRVIPGMPELLGMRAQYELRLEWLAEKRALLLDQMRTHGIEMWIVVSEEFHQDPALYYVAPPLQYARRRDVMVFVDGGDDGSGGLLRLLAAHRRLPPLL